MESKTESLSKKYREAVRTNLFKGSFKEFADIFNDSPSRVLQNYYSDNANTEAQSAQEDDLKPVNLDNIEPTKILGMQKGTFFIVSGVTVLFIAGGLFLFFRKESQTQK